MLYVNSNARVNITLGKVQTTGIIFSSFLMEKLGSCLAITEGWALITLVLVSSQGIIKGIIIRDYHKDDKLIRYH